MCRRVSFLSQLSDHLVFNFVWQVMNQRTLFCSQNRTELTWFLSSVCSLPLCCSACMSEGPLTLLPAKPTGGPLRGQGLKRQRVKKLIRMNPANETGSLQPHFGFVMLFAPSCQSWMFLGGSEEANQRISVFGLFFLSSFLNFSQVEKM